ncbi:acyl-CoA thioesterase [soil metagenome]
MPTTSTRGTAASDGARRSDWVTTVDTVFPHHANSLGTIFGGRVLELLDVNAAIACQRFARAIVVTASTEPIDFRNPVWVGEILELKSRVAWTGRTSMIVRCEVYGENALTGERRLCTMGHMNFVALGDDGRPCPVPELLVATAEEHAHWATGARVREAILTRRATEPVTSRGEGA